MPTFPRLRKKLQDNLSLSTKLSLKVAIAESAKLARVLLSAPLNFFYRVGGAVAARGIPVPQTWQSKVHRFDPPSLSRADLVSAAQKIAAAASTNQRALASVKTSIIIPVFNRAAFTWQCLTSLLSENDLNETEIIVVDNASTDETAELLTAIGNVIRVVTNKENKGFVDACNQGAAAAHGKYLVFLNNDTKVLPGWLKYLIETAESDESAGAIGSMLLYPDGSIQEAGAIVWKNGEAHHYGWNQSPDDHRFNFAREVDYCSAASLLIRKEIFERLEGFDRRFAPAYYEDVDLCFGVRSLGYKVIYQPMSRVVHYEGVTAGRDIKGGAKHFQVANREKFVEKWRAVLEPEHFERDLKPLVDAANRNHAQPRIVVFDERVPSPDRDAGSARMFLILKTLANWSHVVFVPFNRPQDVAYEAALWKARIETGRIEDYRSLVKKKNALVTILSRPSVAGALLPSLKRIAPRIKTIFDTVDINFVRLEREYQLTGDKQFARAARQHKKLETRLARECDLVWCVTKDDQEALAAEAPGARFEIVPTIHPLQDRGPGFAERQGLVFIGNFLHRPNTDAVHYFMREIYPQVREQIPNLRVFIVGDHAPPELQHYASDDVKLTGYVADVDSFFHNCRAMIAPLRFGSGMKGKIGQALSYGLPVVTTSIGAEGMGVENGREVMIADDSEGFAAAVIRLYEDAALWQKLSDNGYNHIARYFTPEVVTETVRQSIRSLASDPERAR